MDSTICKHVYKAKLGTRRNVIIAVAVATIGNPGSPSFFFPPSSIYLGPLPTEKMWQTMMEEGERGREGEREGERERASCHIFQPTSIFIVASSWGSATPPTNKYL